MLSTRTSIKLSKAIECILKDITNTNDCGYALLDSVQEKLKTNYGWPEIAVEEIIEAANNSPIRRLEVLGNQIRLNTGTVVISPFTANVIIPPQELYYGTATSSLPFIRKNGIRSITNDKVKLFTQKEMISVFTHKNSHLVYIEIAALKAHQEGIEFYKYKPYCYATDFIPYKYITKIY